MQGVGVERLSQGFYTEMACFKLADSFSVLFCQGSFFSRGLTIAIFKSGDTTPEAREVFMMLMIVERRMSRLSHSNFVGLASRSHNLGVVFRRISKTNCSVTDVNVCRSLQE